jgi:hypothetical protein
MTILRSLLILVTAVAAIGVPYAFGHALSNHSTTAVLVGAGSLVLAVAFGFLLARGGAGQARR